MAEKYTPKVGDKVRATLGENVLVGFVQDEYTREVPGYGSDDGYLLGFGLAEVWAWGRDGWQFEQVVSVPSKFGAVIRQADGVKFTHAEPGADDAWFGRGFGWVTESGATSGGFTVLFDGVDE